MQPAVRLLLSCATGSLFHVDQRSSEVMAAQSLVDGVNALTRPDPRYLCHACGTCLSANLLIAPMTSRDGR